MNNQYIPLSHFRMALRSFLEQLEEQVGVDKYQVQFGLSIAPVADLSAEQAKTLIRKFEQGLTSLDDSLAVRPVINVNPFNPIDAEFSQGVQKKYETKVTLAEGAQKKLEVVPPGVDSSAK